MGLSVFGARENLIPIKLVTGVCIKCVVIWISKTRLHRVPESCFCSDVIIQANILQTLI